jgi:drug/metabolite transporter (DMT)-like permease
VRWNKLKNGFESWMHPDARLRWKTWVFAIIVILSNALGNLSLAWGMRHQSTAFRLSPLGYITAIFSPYVLLGVSLLILWLLSRMALLSWADLSYVLPVTSLGYVATSMLGRVFFDEQITPWRWTGTLLIVAGMVLVSRGRPDTGGEL